jgi:hypothetical protein
MNQLFACRERESYSQSRFSIAFRVHSGQKKDVFVSFFDCGCSVDEVMAILNKYKEQNSTVILSDGTELGGNSGGGLSYQEVSGLLRRSLDALVTARADHIHEHGRNQSIPAASVQLTASILSNDLVNSRTVSDHEAFMQRVHTLIQQRVSEATKAKDSNSQHPPNGMVPGVVQ